MSHVHMTALLTFCPPNQLDICRKTTFHLFLSLIRILRGVFICSNACDTVSV